MDEIGLVLERVAVSQTARMVVPPPDMVIGTLRRRTTVRMVASSALVVAMIVMFVLALAGVGLASEIVRPSEQVAALAVATR